MTVSFELPGAITELAAGSDLAAMAKEALLVELYREGKITKHQFGSALGMDAYEAEGALKRYGVKGDMSIEEFQRQRDFFRRVR